MNIRTFGPIPVEIETLKTELEKAIYLSEEEIKLVIVYLPSNIEHEPVLKEIKKQIDAPLIGCTPVEYSFTERGATKTGIVGAIFAGDNISVEAMLIPEIDTKCAENIISAISNIHKMPQKGNTLFVLSDYLGTNGNLISTTLHSCIPADWKIIGGLAGDDWTFRGAKIFYETGIYTRCAVVAYINTPKQTGIGIRHGYSIIDNSPKLNVTMAEGNVLKEINNRPAVDVFREEAEKLGFASPFDNILKVAAQHSFGIPTVFEEKLKISTPLGIDKKAFILATPVPKGTDLFLISGTPTSLLEASKNVKNIALSDYDIMLPIGHKGHFVIDCAARSVLLGKRFQEEIRNFIINASSPTLGFTSYGEFAKNSRIYESFHNCSTVSGVF